jgi:hypothetical protein
MARFEFEILTSERPQTYALDRAASGIGRFIVFIKLIVCRRHKAPCVRETKVGTLSSEQIGNAIGVCAGLNSEYCCGRFVAVIVD